MKADHHFSVQLGGQLQNKPLAAKGYTSYRCRNRYGWTMIGAKDVDDAMREARRSDESAKREDLQVWNGSEYVPA